MQDRKRRRRLAARAVVLTSDGSTLLLRYDDVEVGRHWASPGGGLEPGETFRQGALRELEEETGWSDLDLGNFLYAWEHEYTRFGVPVRQYEELFSVFGPKRGPIGDLGAAHRADEILEWRWWTSAELASTEEAMCPPTLPALVARAMQGHRDEVRNEVKGD